MRYSHQRAKRAVALYGGSDAAIGGLEHGAHHDRNRHEPPQRGARHVGQRVCPARLLAQRGRIDQQRARLTVHQSDMQKRVAVV